MREALNDTSITHVVLLDRPGGYVLTEEDFPKDSIWIDGRDVLLEGKGPNPVYLDANYLHDRVHVLNNGFLHQRNFWADDCIAPVDLSICFAKTYQGGKAMMEDMEISDAFCVEQEQSSGLRSLSSTIHYMNLMGLAKSSLDAPPQVQIDARRTQVVDSGWINFPMGSVWRMLNCTLSCTGNVTHELTDSALLGLSKERAWGRWSFLFAARGGPLGFGLAVLGAIVFVRRRNAREGALARLPEQTVAKAQGYCLLRLLGVGHYGRVYLARQESTRQHFAIKVITVYTPRQLEAAYAECRTMLGIRHPHCAQVHSYFSARMEHSLRSVDGNSGSDAYLEQAFQLRGPDAAASPASSAATGTGSLVSTLWRATRLRGSGSSSSDAGTAPSSLAMQVHMVVEFCDHGTLEAAVQSGIFLDPALGRPRMDWVLQTVLEVASGLEYLHAPGRRVVHRDLSAGNGTVAYMSPEVFRTSDVTPALDIYSLGIIMYYVYMGSLPYPDRNPGQVIVEKMREVECGAEERFDIPRDCPAFYRQLILDCTHPQRRERPNAGELVRRLSILLA